MTAATQKFARGLGDAASRFFFPFCSRPRHLSGIPRVPDTERHGMATFDDGVTGTKRDVLPRVTQEVCSPAGKEKRDKAQFEQLMKQQCFYSMRAAPRRARARAPAAQAAPRVRPCLAFHSLCRFALLWRQEI